MIDIHTHFLYDFDDGSKNLKMTKELLSLCSFQGIEIIFLTPHVYSSLSKKKYIEYKNKSIEISKLAKGFGISCYLGAEIYIPFRIPDIDFNKYTMGESKVLLVEFSTILETPVLEHSYNLIKKGFKVIIAHIERYSYLNLIDIINLKKIGVFLQVNSSSLIKKGRSNHLKRAWQYIKKDLVDFVASDSHNTSSRTPNMDKSYRIVEKKIGKKRTKDLFYNNAFNLFFAE